MGMKLTTVAIASFAWACGSSSQGSQLPKRHASVADNLAQSERHEREAEAHEARRDPEPPAHDGRDFHCADDPLDGITYIGTEPYRVMRPCWTGVGDPDEHHREEARRHREAAAAYRARAAELVAAEGRNCAGLGEAEISRSPLTRAADVLAVEALYDDGNLSGARMVLRRIDGLTPDWLQRSLDCHQARAAALGYPPDFMSECPMTLPNTTVEVEDVRDGVEVRIQTADDATAAAVLGRATDVFAARGQ